MDEDLQLTLFILYELAYRGQFREFAAHRSV
jgi:hypothetical protein